MTPLELLIAAARKKVADEAAAKAAQTKAKTAKTEEARQASQQEADRIRNELDWRPVALVALVEAWECDGCMSEGTSPQGVYIYKEHRRFANASIMVRPNFMGDLPDLPRLVKYQNRLVHMCPECQTSFGFVRTMTQFRAEVPSTIPAQSGSLVRDWLAKRTGPSEAA